MKIKLVLRKNPLNETEAKFYAAPVNDGRVSLDEIAEQIAGRASLTHGDILSVLKNCIEVIPLFLLMGKSITDFGFMVDTTAGYLKNNHGGFYQFSTL